MLSFWKGNAIQHSTTTITTVAQMTLELFVFLSMLLGLVVLRRELPHFEQNLLVQLFKLPQKGQYTVFIIYNYKGKGGHILVPPCIFTGDQL